MSADLERSLKDRIKVIARAQNRSFNDLWKTLVLERFLARLSRSDKLDKLIFKGGFLLSKYLSLGRETADLDFSLRTSSKRGSHRSRESVQSLIEEIVSLPGEDEFIFTDIVIVEMNHPHMQYPGFEVSANARLGQTKTAIRLDLGIGDYVIPESRSIISMPIVLRFSIGPSLFSIESKLLNFDSGSLEAVRKRGRVHSISYARFSSASHPRTTLT